MKPLRSLLAAGLALTLVATPAHAITYPVFADTAGSPVSGLLSRSAGAATSLPVTAKSTAYIAFGMSSGLNVPSANAVKAARLVLYFPRVTKAGNLTVFVAGANELGQFREIFPAGTTTQHVPATGAPIAVNPTFGIGFLPSKNFLFLDVTAEVKSWLRNPGTEFGFGISGDATVSVLLGSKEGTGTGHPAVLEVDVDPAQIGSFSNSGADSFLSVASAGVNSTNPAEDRLAGINLSNFSDTIGFTIQARDGTAISGLEIINKGVSTTGLPAMFIDRATGKVGIGTAVPSEQLTVQTSGASFGLLHTNGSVAIGTYVDASGGWIGTQSSDVLNFFTNNSAAQMTLSKNGRLGIGVTATRAKLEVQGNASTTFAGTVAYIAPGSISPNAVGGTDPLSIYASHEIAGAAFLAFSDARLKNVRGRSDGAADLRALTGIEITDYRYKDVIGKGSRPQKKVVAQQVEKVYPQAVSQGTDVVPDIYEKATIAEGWVTLATDLKVGDRVRLIGEKEEGIHEVLEVREGAFRTAFEPADARVFVYGREVKDFRSVDYEAIAMLNVSATQELARKLDAKDAEIAALRERLSRLESMLDDRPARTVRASLK